MTPNSPQSAKFPTIRPAVVGKLNERQGAAALAAARAAVASGGGAAERVQRADGVEGGGVAVAAGLLEETDAPELARGRPGAKLRLATIRAQVLGIAIDAGHCEVVAAGLTASISEPTA